MALLIVLGFLQIVTPQQDTTMHLRAESQALSYISNIQEGTDLEENLWALALLESENHALENFIIENAPDSEPFQTIADPSNSSFRETLEELVLNNGYPNLFIALLLETPEKSNKEELYGRFTSKYSFPSGNGIDYNSLSRALIEEEEVRSAVLPTNRFYLPHLFILFDQNRKKYINDSYIQAIAENWSQTNLTSDSNLRSTLAQATHFRCLYLSDQYSKLSSYYNNLDNGKLLPNSSFKLRLYRYLDYSMYRLGLYDRSLKIVRNYTIPLSEYLGKENLKLSLKELEGVYLYSIGKIQAAEKIYQNILNEITENNIKRPLTSIYNNLALTYHKLGQYDEYLDLQFKALENAEEKDNYSHQLEILNNLFVYHRESNNPESALTYLDRATNLAKTKGETVDVGKMYIYTGSFYRKFKDDYQTAHEYYAKADSLLDSKNNTRLYITLQQEKADAFEQENKYKQALLRYDKILSLIPEDNPNYVDAVVNKALANLSLGQTKPAAELIQKYKNYDLNQLDFQQIVKAKTVEADYLHRTGSSEDAIDILDATLEQVVVRAKSSADLKTGFWHVEEEYLDAFELAVNIHSSMGEADKAVVKLDQLKTINDASYYQNPLVKSSLLDESELTQYKQLTNQLDATRKKLLTAPEEKRFEIRQTISKLNLKKRKLDQKLTRSFEPEKLSIRDVQNQLSSRDLVMHITELKDKYYIAKISRDEVKINTVPLDSRVRNLFTNTVEQVATHKTDLDSLYAISNFLGIKNIPDYVEKVTVIPDSYLYQLPIDILPLSEPSHSYSYGSTTYLIEKFKTQYLTSLNDFTNDKNTAFGSADNSLSYVGYGVSNFSGYNEKSLVPLPYAEEEVKTIADRLTNLSNNRTFINASSTKNRFTETAPKAQILHMATHSSVSERDPMFSTVYLSKSEGSPDSTFSDQIFAYELFELNLDSEMIMLNSCESGSGSYIQGTGVMGISRALQYAGANSLVLNLWSVNDMLASEFAIHFYEQLNRGKSKAEALRSTKQHFLRTKNASPHFWGPYMLIGNSNPIVQPHQDTNLAVAGAFIFYFLLMVGLSYLKNRGVFFDRTSQTTSTS